jgi:4a-hydroxytetrahydrobiopterin dehydratase
MTGCNKNMQALSAEAISELSSTLDDCWVVKGKKLCGEYKFKDFVEAFDFVAKIKDIAESLGHHPDIALGYGYVNIVIFTHAINDLHENDFVLAKKIAALL